jgi:RimJ/RimL family protein N-acetyltransferase
MPVRATASPAAFRAWLDDALARTEAGLEVAFSTVDRTSGRPLGSTRYLTLRPEHRGLEIGWTWLARDAWSSGANVEAKLLMLEHAFERLGCMRVEFKTEATNERSRAALAALPARFEGVFRKHMLVRGGAVRDSAYYAITDDEWPAVKAALERRISEKS